MLDSDCLIKLTKAGVLDALLKSSACFVPQEVFEEVVIVGKRLFYKDAEEISRIVEQGRIRVVPVVCQAHPSLGKGEVAAKELAVKIAADAVLSDDQRFLSELESEGIAFMNSTHAIVWLKETKSVTRDEALIMMERLRQFISEGSHQTAIAMIGGKRK